MHGAFLISLANDEVPSAVRRGVRGSQLESFTRWRSPAALLHKVKTMRSTFGSVRAFLLLYDSWFIETLSAENT